MSPTSGPSTGGDRGHHHRHQLHRRDRRELRRPHLPTFTVTNSTTIAATAPPGTGTVDVTVTTRAGTSSVNAADQFTYVAGPPLPPTVASVDPVSGPAGSLVTVRGTEPHGATAVHFGAAAATFTVNNDTTITATAPAGTGTVDVTVTTPTGTSAGQPGRRRSPTPRVRRRDTIPSPVAGGWQLNGSAAIVNTPAPANLQLTPATNWLAGSAFCPTPVPGAGVTAAFDAFIGPDIGRRRDDVHARRRDRHQARRRSAATAAVKGSRASTASPSRSTTGRTAPTRRTTSSASRPRRRPAVAELRDDELVDPVAHQHDAPLRGDDVVRRASS